MTAVATAPPGRTTRTRRSAFALLAMMSALVDPSAAGEQHGLRADAALQHAADSMQRCLERRLAPWQIESIATVGDQQVDTVRFTRWGGTPDVDCRTQTGSPPAACVTPDGLQRAVRLDFAGGEPHPAWSANDRARLEDLIPATLRDLSGEVRLLPIVATHPDQAGEALRVRLTYLGMPTLQRDLAEWVRAPRGLSVTMTLVDVGRGGRVLASREITFRQAPRLSGEYGSASGEAWMRRLLKTVDATATDLIAPLACTTPWFGVTNDRGQTWLSTGSYTGLAEGRPVLLVPTVDAAPASRWPIARVRASEAGGRARLDFIRGSPDVCEAGCRAIPL